MQLGRYQVSTLRPPPILSIDFSHDGRHFSVATESGYEVWRSCPLALIRRRDLAGTLARVLILPDSPLLALQGGGKSPLYPPNKVVIYHDSLDIPVAELEFGERIRGLACRSSTLCVALSRRVLAYEYGSDAKQVDPNPKGKGKASGSKGGFWIRKVGEWETAQNESGLMALATDLESTMLAIPGRQPGHVQLVSLPPCRSHFAPLRSHGPSRSHATLSFRSPIILAHTHALSYLGCTASGYYLITTSERGTLVRIWDTARGRLERELRRGVDRAEMWGAQFEGSGPGSPTPGEEGHHKDERKRKGGRIVGWSDKGTIHVWGDPDGDTSADAGKSSSTVGQAAAITSLLSRNLPLPKYFSSSPSAALYHLPRKNPHAFASTMNAAAEAARMPSMKMREAVEEEGDWNERFVVGWVMVEVPVASASGDAASRRPSASREEKKRASLDGRMGGLAMGLREERRSFGSESTNTRTATPTLGRAETPTPSRKVSNATMSTLSGQRSTSDASGATTMKAHRRLASDGAKAGRFVEADKNRLKSRVQQSPTEGKTRLEKQLVAITYGGDWYRLRLPDAASLISEGDEDQGKVSRKCELVEYRRLNVGGSGW